MSFLDRFVHPRLAAATLFGLVVWLGAFLVAAAGLAARATGDARLAVTLFAVSGDVGVLALVVLSGCSLWFVWLYVRRFLRSRGE